MEPLVSVVIPAHNSEASIRAKLDSILAQPHRPLEILVVDAGSTDATPDIVNGYAPEVRLIRQAQSGHAAARNAGIRAARGEFLAFLEHDDLWSLHKLALQFAAFYKDPDLDLVFGHMQNFFSPELPEAEREKLAAPMQPLPGLRQSAMLARRASFDRIGLFDEQCEMDDFVNWYDRAMLGGLKVQMLPEVLVHRRIHTTNDQSQILPQ